MDEDTQVISKEMQGGQRPYLSDLAEMLTVRDLILSLTDTVSVNDRKRSFKINFILLNDPFNDQSWFLW